MSATTVANAPQAEANGKLTSPVEYVLGLPPEHKQAIFLALIREAISMFGDAGRMIIEDEDGSPLGYYVPPAKTEGEFLPEPTLEQEVEMERRSRSPGISGEELIADLKTRLAALQQKQS